MGRVWQRVFQSLILTGLLASATLAAVSVRVYRADELTPLAPIDPNVPNVYGGIMVGTRLTLFIVSDAPATVWSGGLQIPWEQWEKGTVTGRGFNPTAINFDASILPASGRDTRAIDSPSSDGMAYSLSVEAAQPGQWIVLDYYAETVGTCDIGLFAYEAADELPPGYNPFYGEPPPGKSVWVQALSFNHVPSRDYDDDTTVNFVDFASWAGQWDQPVAPDPNGTSPADLNADEFIDIADLGLFCDFWLERTDSADDTDEPDLPVPAE